MPDKKTLQRAEEDKREGKSPSTQAGEFVREEMDHIREGKHGARSAKQAIAIGLSKARRAGVELPAPEKGEASEETRKKAKADNAKGKRRSTKKPSKARSRAAKAALKQEGRAAASTKSLSRQAKGAAKERTATERSRAAKKGARTKGAAGRSAAAKKAAATRQRNAR